MWVITVFEDQHNVRMFEYTEKNEATAAYKHSAKQPFFLTQNNCRQRFPKTQGPICCRAGQ
ncbi:MAG: hypothetical protein KIG60_09730, partial [Caryophanon sp.]|nr:hypothetical protein [Caryophanon sp.]